MMKKKKNKIIIVLIIMLFCIILMFSLKLFANSSKDKYYKIKRSIENVFFYLENDKYENMDEMSDFCKVVLVYNSPYMKKEGNNRYSKQQLMNSLRKILGNNIHFSYNLNEMDTYNFMIADSCLYGNMELKNLSYDSLKNEFYISNNSNDSKINKNYLQVSWEKPIENGDIITLKAKALLIEKNDNSYTIYTDLERNESLGEYKTLNEAKKIAKKSMDYSIDYEFELRRINNNVIWQSFRKNKISSDTIID